MRLGRENSVIVERIAAWLSLAIAVIAIALASLAAGPALVYGGTINGATTVTATVSAAIDSNKVVTVSGAIGATGGQPVSVMITDPNGKLEYVNNATTASGGSYSFSYTMSNTATGTYNVTVDAPGLTGPVTTSFVYNAGQTTNSTVSATIDSNKVVTVSGAIGATGGQPVSVMITDPNGKLEYVNNTTTAAGGAFSLSYTMSSTAQGTYQVIVGSAQLTAPLTTSFVYLPGSADLESLAISSGSLAPAFAPGTTAYTVSVAYGVSSETVTPTAADPKAVVKVNGTVVASGTASGAIALSTGGNTITVAVTASDGTTTEAYTITVTRAEAPSGGGGGSTPVTYTVSFNSEGGSAVASLTGVVSGSIISAPANPTKTGYNFGGWYKEAACVNPWNFSTDKVTGNLTLYAKWTVVTPTTYTVTYDGNGSTGGTVPKDSNTYASGATVTVLGPGNLAATGFAFTGWNTEASGNGTSYQPNSTFVMGSANVTLCAQWTQNALQTYTVTFDGNGGTPSESSITVTEDQPYGTLATASYTGYTFDGWFTAKTGGTQVTASTTVNLTADQTLYAQWTASLTLTVNNINLPNGAETVPYSVNASVYATPSGGTSPYHGWRASGLPDGLSMDSTGEITGTPTDGSPEDSPYSVSVTVYDSSNPQQWASATLELTINPAPPTVVSATADAINPEIVIVFSESMNYPLQAIPGQGFTVTDNGVSVNVNGVGLDPNDDGNYLTYDLHLDNSLNPGDTITLSYDGSADIESQGGGVLAAFSKTWIFMPIF